MPVLSVAEHDLIQTESSIRSSRMTGFGPLKLYIPILLKVALLETGIAISNDKYFSHSLNISVADEATQRKVWKSIEVNAALLFYNNRFQ